MGSIFSAVMLNDSGTSLFPKEILPFSRDDIEVEKLSDV